MRPCPPDTGSVVFISGMFKLAFMVATGAAWWILMRLVRWSQGVSWSEHTWPGIRDGNMAVALYAGLLAVALAIAMGLAAG